MDACAGVAYPFYAVLYPFYAVDRTGQQTALKRLLDNGSARLRTRYVQHTGVVAAYVDHESALGLQVATHIRILELSI